MKRGMGRVALVELVGGLSGDMLLSALHHLGVSFAPVEQAFSEYGWKVKYHFQKVRVERISGYTARVDFPEEARWNMRSVKEAIQKFPLSQKGKKKVVDILTTLLTAEAKVHGIPRSKVHLHEIGSLDTLTDVAGVVFGFEQLGVEEMVYSEIPVGMGKVMTQQGVLPNPPPAVLFLSQGLKIRKEEIPVELSTPTGVALLRALGRQEGLTAFRFLSCGYGFGARRSLLQSALRIWLGAIDPAVKEMVEMETLVDDLSPEVLAELPSLLLNAGAVDAFITPVLGKKGRPSFLLTTLTDGKNLPAILHVLFQESTTLGVRWREVKRLGLVRETREVKTLYGRVPMKIGYWKGEVVGFKPEYEKCRALARKWKVPLKSVMLSAVEEFQKKHAQKG